MKKQSDLKELKKLSRKELLELMLRQSRKIDELTTRLNEAEQQLQTRAIRMEQSGSIAEAALRLSGIFEDAQRACDQYTESVRQQNEELSRRTREICSRMLDQARAQAEEIRVCHVEPEEGELYEAQDGI